jgi:signal peptidase I
VRLEGDAFFALGDNTLTSNDSRYWKSGPAVRAAALVGKPLLVHMPSRTLPVVLFDRPVFWIPDLRQIRYIR